MRTPLDAAATTILVVDDNPANRALAEATLTDEGYRVLLAESGAEGLDVFAAQLVDCVLLDVRMPGDDGFAVCKALRATEKGARVPVLFFTALRDVETFDRAAKAGGDDFLTKPIRPTELVARVQTALELRRVDDALRGSVEALKRQRDDLQRAQLATERLTAYVVHDLKNPVSVIDLQAQVLAYDPDLSVDTRSSLGRIRSSVRRLVRMIDNLLDVSKGAEGKLAVHRRDVDLEALISEVAEELAASAAAAKVTLRGTAGAKLAFADPDLLRRALVNLVENAIRYAPKGTVVDVATLHAGTGCDLTVSDAGQGVPASQHEAIFEPFVQLVAKDSGAAGSRGLGLAFCRLVAEAHGGHITVADARPGALFRLHLPYAG